MFPPEPIATWTERRGAVTMVSPYKHDLAGQTACWESIRNRWDGSEDSFYDAAFRRAGDILTSYWPELQALAAT